MDPPTGVERNLFGSLSAAPVREVSLRCRWEGDGPEEGERISPGCRVGAPRCGLLPPPKRRLHSTASEEGRAGCRGTFLKSAQLYLRPLRVSRNAASLPPHGIRTSPRGNSLRSFSSRCPCGSQGTAPAGSSESQ